MTEQTFSEPVLQDGPGWDSDGKPINVQYLERWAGKSPGGGLGPYWCREIREEWDDSGGIPLRTILEWEVRECVEVDGVWTPSGPWKRYGTPA